MTPAQSGWPAHTTVAMVGLLDPVADASDGPWVFLVDDDADVRRAVARLLRARGFAVATYPSAEAFLERPPRSDRPCCLVMDLRLPGLCGLDLHDRLGSMGIHIPVVFVSGCADVPSSVRAMK